MQLENVYTLMWKHNICLKTGLRLARWFHAPASLLNTAKREMEGMNDSSQLVIQIYEIPPNTVRSLPTDKQAAFNWIDWGEKTTMMPRDTNIMHIHARD